MKRAIALMLFSLPLPISAVLLFFARGTEYEYILMLNLFFPVIPLIITGIGSHCLVKIDIARASTERLHKAYLTAKG